MKINTWFAGVVSIAAVLAGLSTAGAAGAAAAHRSAASRPPGPPAVKGVHPVSAGIPMPGAAVRPDVKPGAITYTSDWTGYVAVANKHVALRYVAADFNVPSINCTNSPAGSAGPATASQWVGLDDISTVEQIGIGGDCSGGAPKYYGWYETFPPDNPVTLPATISAGDAIVASVYYDSATKLYHLLLRDITTGQDFPVSAPCPAKAVCHNGSAEAISSAPHFGPGKGWNLADYGMENFTNGAVTSRSGVKGNFAGSRLWGSSEFVMIDNADHVLAYPSQLQGGSAYSTSWLAPS